MFYYITIFTIIKYKNYEKEQGLNRNWRFNCNWDFDLFF